MCAAIFFICLHSTIPLFSIILILAAAAAAVAAAAAAAISLRKIHKIYCCFPYCAHILAYILLFTFSFPRMDDSGTGCRFGTASRFPSPTPSSPTPSSPHLLFSFLHMISFLFLSIPFPCFFLTSTWTCKLQQSTVQPASAIYEVEVGCSFLNLENSNQINANASQYFPTLFRLKRP